MASLKQKFWNLRETLEDILEEMRSQLDDPAFRFTAAALSADIQNAHDMANIFKETYIDLTSNAKTSEDKKTAGNEHRKILREYVDITRRAEEKLSEMTPASRGSGATSTSSTSQPREYELKLPTIQIEPFHVEYTKWPSFCDVFTSLVHNKASISGVEKLQLLKNCLRGDAAATIAYIPVTNENYEEAWESLKSKFENKRLIVNKLLDQLLEMPKITTRSSLKNIANSANGIVRSLRALNLPVDNWDAFLCRLVETKLDKETTRSWEEKQDRKIPKFKTLMGFLQDKINVYEAESSSSQGIDTSPDQGTTRKVSSASPACPACQAQHKVYNCELFRKASVAEKFNLIKTSRRCLNCLEPFHSANQCRSSGCKQCGGKHNSLLHDPKYERRPSGNSRKDDTNKHENATVATSQIRGIALARTLLGTANVYIKNKFGSLVKIRALLDQGSQTTVLTADCARKLQLPIETTNMEVSGIGNQRKNVVKGQVQVQIRNEEGDFEYTGYSLVMDQITPDQPSQEIVGEIEVAKGLKLADENYNKPGPIDALLGVDVYMKACRRGLRHPKNGGPGAQSTAFGWVLMGSIPDATSTKDHPRSAAVNLTALLDPTEFWAIQEVPDIPVRTKEDLQCEALFKRTTTRQNDGRYVVRLPLSSEPTELGESRSQAVKRFHGLEMKFQRNPDFAKDYKQIIQEYIDLGHLERVPDSEKGTPGYYIPHHAVIKESSKSTRVRVVFDASAKSSSNKSLNDILLTGPRIQDELFKILLRFRTHRVAITADIEKMYRMIVVDSADRHLQRIIWRPNTNQPLVEFQLTRVSFGVKSAPFLAIRTLHQCAEDNEQEFPAAARILKEDFYVDDLLTGADSVTEAKHLQMELQQLLQNGGFNLTKWSSNSDAALENVPYQDRSVLPMMMHKEEYSYEDAPTKTLGVKWHPQSDVFGFQYELPAWPKHTKRTVLSDMAHLFDPLGWLSPVTITGRIFCQQLWREDIDWDTPLPPNLLTKWESYRNSLKEVNKLSIKRCIKGCGNGTYSLYGYADASESAYGACVYLITQTETDKEAQLVAAKTKVASIRTMPLPRLELCAALLLAELLESVESALQLEINEVHAFTDSMVTLQWITNQNVRWKTFVANRVGAIYNAVPHAQWHHVPGKDNIADCISRGIPINEFLKLEDWWRGPPILHSSLCISESNKELTDVAMVEARRPAVLTTIVTPMQSDIIARFSKLPKLLRTIAWIHRFKLKLRKLPRNEGHISTEELTAARMLCIKNVQESYYPTIVQKNCIPQNLQQLNPFKDSNGIIRVGGRLRNAEISVDQRNPILLPGEAHFSLMIVRHIHEETLHGGPQLMLTTLRQQYWIMGGKNLVKQVYRNCVTCQRLRAKSCQQLMGDLPKARVTAAQPFLKTGCDFMGPFYMRTKTGRGSQRYKSYVALFICFTTRAIHLECVSDMTTSAFLAALKRFIARRGKPAEMFSDLGTNFVGGNNELKTYMELANKDERNKEIGEQLSTLGINWHFNPGGAPHMGGLWEAGVKSTKYHLKRIIGENSLTYEELHTVLCQIEAVLNSRPLVEMSDDPLDYQALTPGHFLIGRPLLAHPEPNYQSEKANHLTRWSLLQQMVQHFWKRWHSEYLTRLQQRPKWLKSTENLSVGELVLIKEDNTPPLQWKLGRIQEVFPGSDGKVRVVNVKTANGSIFKRPITKICQLPDTTSPDDSH